VPVSPATGRVYGGLQLRANRRLTEQLDALDRTHFSEMKRATTENARLQRALAAGDVRMSVRARCQPDAGLGDGTAGRC
jgi:predicted sugar kinase